MRPHTLTYSTLTHTCARSIYKYTHSSTVVDFMSASSMKAASPFLSLTFHFLSPSLSITLSLSIAFSLSPSLAHSLCNSLSFFCLRCWESSFILFCFFSPSLNLCFHLLMREVSCRFGSFISCLLIFLSLSRHVSWFQTLNLSLCLSLDPAFPMHLPAAEGYRDSSLPSFSPAPTPAPPPLPPLLHLSSSRFLTEG